MGTSNRRRAILEAFVDKVLGLPPATDTYVKTADLVVPMPDGAVLLGDLYQSASLTGPGPVVVIRLPYGRGGNNGAVFGPPLARRGLQVFIQSTRGTFGSGGQFRPLTTEHQDGLATLAWVREQPWCDGRVATTGGSYFGHTQWAVAPYADPPLAAAAMHVTAAEFTRTFYEGGAPSIRTALGWAGTIGRQERRSPLLSIIAKPLDNRRLDKALQQLPLQAADVAVSGAPVAFWRDFVDHGDLDDSFWDATNHHEADLSRMPPVSMVTGWWDLFVRDQLHDFTRLREAGVDARLMVGPWIHGEPAELKAIVSSDLTWLRHHLLDGPAPEGGRVQFMLLGADEWVHADTWPPPGGVGVTLHLRAGGALMPDPAATEHSSSRFTYDPADPTPTAGGPLLVLPGKQVDQAEIESRGDVLVFTGPPLESDLDLVGSTRAQIFVRSELQWVDVHVRVCDVDPKGLSRNVVDAIRRLDPRTMDAPDVEVLEGFEGFDGPGEDGEDAAGGAGGTVRVDLELFPIAYRFPAGHRIRVQVAAGAFPRYARNLGTGEPFGTSTGMRTNRVEVLHDAGHPSRLVLPVHP